MARHAVPHVIEGVVLPAAVFYATLAISGSVWAAITSAVTWSYLLLARRAIGQRRMSGLLILTALTLSVRFSVSVLSGSTFTYFVQPAIGQLAVAATFLVSLRWEQPILLRLTGDIVPLETLAGRPYVMRFFRQITLIWAVVLVAHATAGVWLLLSLPVEVYVVTKALFDGAIKAVSILASIWWFRRTLRREGVTLTLG
jgi:hypothetical protein